MENPYLTSIAREGGKHAWIGKLPPFEFDPVDMDSCTNFRVDAHFHHSYDVVWLFEKPLETYSLLSWKIIVDEAVRLLKREGTLIINFHPSQDFTLPMVKHFLGRHSNLDVAVAYEKDNIFVFRIKRLHFEKYSDDSWTFAILTTGNKDKEVIAFLDSVRRNDKDNRHEIIISGPQKKSYDAYHVRYLDMSQFRDDEYMEISKKKNAIAALATHANLLIVHDRYYLGDNFFEGFERFGYDFDLVAVNQKFENGETFPFYTAVYPPFLSWTHPVNFTNYNVLSSSQYVNGGAIAIKTHTLQKLPFNSLLMWSQMEDVEMTGFLMHHSIIPRVNILSTLYTYDYQKGRTNSFKLFDQYDGNDVIHKVEIACRSQYADFVNKNSDNVLLLNDKSDNDNTDTLLYINDPFRLHISKKKKFPFIRISSSGKQLKNFLAMWLGGRGIINISSPFKLHVTMHKHFPFMRISGKFRQRTER